MKKKRNISLWAKRFTALVVMVCLLCGMAPGGFTVFEPLEAEATSLTADQTINWVKSISGTKVGSGQCVALVAAYIRYLGHTPPSCNYAYEYKNKTVAGWQTIAGVQPQKGDILIYTGGYGGYGHVAIYESDYVTWHQNDKGDQFVKSLGIYYKLEGYGSPSLVYWGVMRPDFKSSTPTSALTTPTISTNLPSYVAGETADITWAKSSGNCDFYQYWLIVKNLTENKQVFAGATGANGDMNANSCTITFGSAGTYKITVYAVPYTNKDALQKVSTKTITVEKEQYGANVEPQAAYVYNGHLYELYDYRVPFEHARVTASKKGGHLVSITSSGEQTAVMSLIKENSDWDYPDMGWYIGATDSAKEGTWKWDSGEAFSYKNWNTGEPNNSYGGKDEDFASVQINGKWNDIIGTKFYPYIVEYDSLNYNVLKPTKTATYDFGTGKSVYEMYDTKVTVADAKKIAQAKGGTLLSITSDQEMKQIYSLVQTSPKKDKPGTYWYIGLSDAAKEGTWKWDNGDAFSYKNWNTNEPNNNDSGKPENYVVVQPGGKWNDVSGALRYGFIVERTTYNELTTPTITTNKNTYYLTDEIYVNWAKSAANTDLSYYKLTVKNLATNETVKEKNIEKNSTSKSYVLNIPTAGKYQITVSAVPEHDPAKRQKVSSKTIEVSATPVTDWNIVPVIETPSFVKAGDLFEVKVRLIDSPQLANYMMDLQYDNTLLEIAADAEKNLAVDDERNGKRNLQYNANTVRFVGASLSGFDWNSDFFTVVFKAKGDFYGDKKALFKLSTKDGFFSTTGERTDLIVETTAETIVRGLEEVIDEETDTGKEDTNEDGSKDTYVNIEEKKVEIGDANGDGSVSSQDALAILKHLAKLKLDRFMQEAADVDGDGSVNSQDALTILKRLAGLIKSFPAQK